MDMINIGYSGASTAQVELNVTAQNTANAMITGYTRQVAEISTIGASGGSPNSAGNGVQVDSIRRVSNQYQVNQDRKSTRLNSSHSDRTRMPSSA